MTEMSEVITQSAEATEGLMRVHRRVHEMIYGERKKPVSKMPKLAKPETLEELLGGDERHSGMRIPGEVVVAESMETPVVEEGPDNTTL